MSTEVAPGASAKKSRGLGCAFLALLGVSLFVGAMVAVIVPAAQKLTAPIVCDGGQEAVVTTSTSTNMDGESSMTSAFYCADGQGRAHHRSTPLVMGALGLEVFVALLLWIVIGQVRDRVRRSREVR